MVNLANTAPVSVIGFKVAKSLPASVKARKNPGPETGIPVGRAVQTLVAGPVYGKNMKCFLYSCNLFPTAFCLKLQAIDLPHSALGSMWRPIVQEFWSPGPNVVHARPPGSQQEYKTSINYYCCQLSEDSSTSVTQVKWLLTSYLLWPF